MSRKLKQNTKQFTKYKEQLLGKLLYRINLNFMMLRIIMQKQSMFAAMNQVDYDLLMHND